MKIFPAILLACLILTINPAAAAEERASVRLPITVKILDFETTKKICGQPDAPAWCPAHLLVTADNAHKNTEPSIITDQSETAKRARIAAIKKQQEEEGL